MSLAASILHEDVASSALERPCGKRHAGAPASLASVLRATSNGYTALTICLYPQLEFLQSAARASELPPADVELAFVGRSNVGKSSVLNAVTGRKELARISKTLGYPQVIKVFEVEPGHWIVDLPCCSFAAAPRRGACATPGSP